MSRRGSRQTAATAATAAPSAAPTAGELWRQLVSLVKERREDSRREVRALTGLPAGRVRVLRWLTDGALTLSELAEAIGSDAPSTTVTVNDLEDRGLVVREPHPTNRRAKLVSLTAAGRGVVARTMKIIERPPEAFAQLAPADLAAFARVLDALKRAPATAQATAGEP